jgi:AraC-like DNA-binding protein
VKVALSIITLPFLTKASKLLRTFLYRRKNNPSLTSNSSVLFDSKEPLVKEKNRYEKSGLNPEKLNEFETIIVRHVEKTKIYLNTELTLEDLSERTRLPKHHITQVLNEKMKKNFYSFINEYRIIEASRLLREHSKSVNMLSLAIDCGFNSKSSFNNYFKKIMQETPSSYRKKFSNKIAPSGNN